MPIAHLNSTRLFFVEVGEGLPGWRHFTGRLGPYAPAWRDRHAGVGPGRPGRFRDAPSQARILHEGIPGSELIVFEHSGHFPYLEEPEAFFGAVRGWLERA